ncbi:YdbH domain-containing protein [Phenylobacterium sp. J426]|uniref:YdbH domain-containing protein n=1 Tax=Phenylobacterium sp. J426 TaxID=2898439 RepID=UPI00215092AA|nr:YdbH domain-containing protein [Phenylobacterium sp. J426]MCR5874251.1 YdbH domain-containing protein [Phenylobacterium sp. J426]
MTEPAARTVRPLRLILALVGVALVVLAALTWLNRRTLAREALTGWLRSKGIASEAEVYAIGPSSFSARLRVGDPARPDFQAARADVRYRFKGVAVEVLSVTLRRPVLRASLRNGRFSVGALDPLIEEFTRRPPRPDAAKPTIAVDDGVLWLTTDYGPVKLTADACVENNRLMSLAAVADPARLKGRGLSAETGRATLAVTTRGPRLSVRLEAPLTAVESGALSLRQARLVLTADAPYPDMVKRRSDGGVTLSARLTGRSAALAAHTLEAFEADAAFVGQSRGWIPDLALSGRATTRLRAENAKLGPARAVGLRLAATSEDLQWTRAGGDRLAAGVRATAVLDRGAASGMTLTRTTLSAAGPVTATAGGARAALTGSLVGRGAYSGLGPVTSGDTGDLAAVKRAARGFGIAAPRLGLTLAPGKAPALALPRPVVLKPDAGGVVTLASSGANEWRLTARGGGLPEIDATAQDVRLADGEASAGLNLKATLSLGPLERARLDAGGRLRLAGGAVTLVATRCAPLAIDRLEFGENDVEAVSGRLCPGAEPMFRMAGGDWRIAGRAEAASADAPFLQAGARDAFGPVALELKGGRLDADARIDRARLVDLAPEPRFHPLALTGIARARRDAWTAELDIAAGRHPVAHAGLVHDGPTGQGRVDIDTGVLTFADGGLQPAQISPLAAALGPPATGQARFEGGFAWNPVAGISAGTLTVPRLDFVSPAGPITNLSGTLVFTSLAPLVAAPGQVVSVERLDAIVPVTGLKAEVGLKDDVLTITGGEAAVGGGRVRLERLELPLDPAATRKGLLAFEGVQLHDLIEASPFGDRVEFDAVVSGRIPFETVGQRVRITGGELEAIKPGRLSIQREALSGVQTDPQQVLADGQPVPDQAQANAAVTDFAYQAMENLAFNQLALSLNSREDGRMSALFHIVGRHDPPKKQEIRLGLMELLQRRFLDKPLPLPSGTGVNLTLDTTLNLDDLLADYAEYQRLRNSGPVQP